MPRPTQTFTGGSAARKRGNANARRSSRSGRSGADTKSIFLGLLLGSVLSFAGIITYFYLGHPPVAVADKPALWEHLTETVPLRRRVSAEAKQPPFSAGEDGFESAARIYHGQCAQCHGTPGHEAVIGQQTLPRAQQFFGRDRRATAARPTGELFWPAAFGIRRSGMPAFRRTLSNTELWNLALLLHSADQDLPEPIRTLLSDTPPPAITNRPAANPAAPINTHRLGPENDFR